MASSEKLPVAIIGVGGFGKYTLEALCQSDRVELVGLSDLDAKTAEAAGKATGVEVYTDNRSLLVETNPQALFIATPPTAVPELIAACGERGIHVWLESPLARNLEEAVTLVHRMEKAKLKFAVGTQRRFAPGYRLAHELRSQLGDVFLSRAHYLFNWGPSLNWRGDKASAGGGALLELGYHPIDLLIWLLGLPEDVYGLSTVGNRPEKQGPDDMSLPVYDTDDSAAAILRYNSGCIATVVTTRSSGPVSEELCLHGRGGSLMATSETCFLRDPDGNVQESESAGPAQLDAFRRQVDAFVNSILSKAKYYECSALENLLTMSVIEAIYLSDKTSQPESPQRLLATHDIGVKDCLKYQAPTSA